MTEFQRALHCEYIGLRQWKSFQEATDGSRDDYSQMRLLLTEWILIF